VSATLANRPTTPKQGASCDLYQTNYEPAYNYDAENSHTRHRRQRKPTARQNLKVALGSITLLAEKIFVIKAQCPKLEEDLN
jgi:hypothetical protein